MDQITAIFAPRAAKTYNTPTVFGGYAGAPCINPGVYQSFCLHRHRIHLEMGQPFPSCLRCDLTTLIDKQPSTPTYWSLWDYDRAVRS